MKQVYVYDLLDVVELEEAQPLFCTKGLRKNERTGNMELYEYDMQVRDVILNLQSPEGQSQDVTCTIASRDILLNTVLTAIENNGEIQQAQIKRYNDLVTGLQKVIDYYEKETLLQFVIRKMESRRKGNGNQQVQ